MRKKFVNINNYEYNKQMNKYINKYYYCTSIQYRQYLSCYTTDIIILPI